MRFRSDIQALRGFAVSLVLLTHAGLPPVGGYLGVDVFFVISGFLITRIIRDGLRDGSFSFSSFYLRRARRLLPAALATYALTVVAALWFLNSLELRDLMAQVAGAITFTINFVLWSQTGYFEGAAELKPLLHIWSLSIEEQYYIALPALLAFCPKRYWLSLVGVILAASLGFCLWLASTNPDAAFYLLPTRAWELLIGSVAALGTWDGERCQNILRALFWPAFACLLAVPFLPLGGPHPGLNAALVCFATAVVILRRHPFAEIAPVRGLARVGDVSYSLYLAHWPVMAFLNNSYVGEVPLDYRLAALAIGIAAGVALYWAVERPFRFMKYERPGRFVAATVAASVAVIAVQAGAVAASRNGPDFAEVRRINRGFGEPCEFRNDFSPISECRNSDAPEILVWGDSEAMHLVPGIAVTTDKGVVQATRSACGPFLNIAPFNNARRHNYEWALDCIQFNASVLAYLEAQPSIETVVLGSIFNRYVAKSGWELVLVESGAPTNLGPTEDIAVEAMKRTIEAIRAHGRKVVIVSPTPSTNDDLSGCVERRVTGKVTLGSQSDCRLDETKYRRLYRDVHAFLDRVSREAEVAIVDLSEPLCNGGTCATEFDGVPLYRDSAHLSHQGSVKVAHILDFGRILPELAR